MGWASGSYLAEEIWDEIKIYIPENKLQEVASKIYDSFCDKDADDWSSNPEGVWAIACPDEWLDYAKEMAECDDIPLDEMIEKMKGW